MWTAIQRYGLDYCDFPTMLSNVSSLLRILALNVDGRNNKNIPIVFVILAVVCSILYIYTYVVSGIWYIIWRSKSSDDLAVAFIVFSLTVTSVVTIIKLYYMMFYKEQLKQITNKCLKCEAQIVSGSRYSSNMLKNLRNVKKRGLIFWWTIVVDAIGYVISPLFNPGRHLTMDSYIIYGLEPMLESPNFEIATIIMSIDVIFICYLTASVTCFFILIIGYVEAQMLSLSEEMTHLWADAKYHYKKITKNNKLFHYIKTKGATEDDIVNKYVKDHLIDFMGRHAMTKSNLQEIEDLMKVPNAIGFVLLITGLIAELVGGLDKTYLQVPFTMLQISMDCYLSQKVMDSNVIFEQAVYDCKWENFNESNKRIVLLMLMNSQKTMTMSAGGMVTLSFEYLMTIIRTTYSTYTTLRSMV